MKKTNNSFNKELTNKGKRATILFAIVGVLLIGLVSGFLINVIAAEEPAQTYDIHSAEEFIAYSQAYKAGNRNPKDKLNITINQGNVVTDDGFISLGTYSRPFSGELVIPTAGIDVFHLFNCPLFDYVSTDLKITGAGVVKIVRERANELPAPEVLTSGSLFANHVVAGNDPANWIISLLPYEGDGKEATDFAGVIGDIASNAEVSISFTNTAMLNVVGDSNVGLICGTLNDGAALNVVTAGSGSSISVTASSGQAGGLVGQMKPGAVLNIDSGNNSRVNSVTANNNYAGGIVGKVDNVTSGSGIYLGTGVTDYAINGSVMGKNGAGGLFGYYRVTSGPDTLTLENTYKISGVTIGGSGKTGGVFGAFINESDLFTFIGNGHNNQEAFSISLNGGSMKGGIAGSFQTNSLNNTLLIKDFQPSINTTTGTSAGLIGKIEGDIPAYIHVDGKINPIIIFITGQTDAGLVADLGDKGSFLDIEGNLTVSGSCNSGLVDKMTDGVLRIKGVTDLSECKSSNATFVNNRGTALIYSIGSGSDSSWTLKRRTANAVDDIKSWGEVVRTGASGFTENDIFIPTGHTVQVKSAPDSYAIGTVADFARMALNIQLNTNGNKGALQFASEDVNKSTIILKGDISLSTDISLSGTGITGLTRDNNYDAVFSGTFNGKNHTLAFATGEVYGKIGNVLITYPDYNRGNIYTHTHNGLFAKIDGADVDHGKVYDLKLAGSFYIRQYADMKLGGVAAEVSGYCTIDNVDSSITINIKSQNEYGYYGGVIGIVNSGSTVSIKSGTTGIKPIVNDIHTESGNSEPTFVGGVIGNVEVANSGTTTQSITFKSSSKIGLNYVKEQKNSRTSVFGAAIAGIKNTNYIKDARNIVFEDSVEVDITANGASADNQIFGGILGCQWYAADVVINNMVVSNVSITANNNANFGGLVQTATGHWDINSISLTENKAVFSIPGGTFGFVANKTYNSEQGKTGALYLDVDNTGSNYNISNLTFSGSPDFTVFDEIVADSRFNNGNGANDITNNGNSIISISTTGNTINSTNLTYLNKTSYGITNKTINPQTRYYYNLEAYRSDSASNAQKFLVWSVDQYAHSSLKDWFTQSSFTGNLDMTGLSYYPIDLATDVTFDNATIKLDNNLMESYVKIECSGGDGKRTTRKSDNQHYLMHTAIFRNANSNNITILGASGLTIQGNVPRLSDGGFCGFIVAGTLGNSDTKSISFNASKITVEGARITNNNGSVLTTTVYAPLIINKIGKNTNLIISSAEQKTPDAQTNYGLTADQYAASSLIGDVGNNEARSIYLTFTGLKFDGRSSATSIGNLDTAYGTNKSIFSRATILNSFQFAGEGLGTYNYELDKDWTGPSTAVHNVTYGKEITLSIEYSNQEKKYLNSEYYTHPTSYLSESEYTFSSGFLPYVYDVWDGGLLKANHHEIRVNISVSTDDITGCGKYSDPYIITTGGQLEYISKVIQGIVGDISTETKITLPVAMNQTTDCPKSLGKANTDFVYSFNGTQFVSSGHSNKPLASVREYLAGAYYVISQNIELSSSYVALGTYSDSDDAKYSFKGVLVGRNTTITNKSDNPLIATSVGAVIKDLTIDVKGDSQRTISLAPTSGSQTYSYNGSERIVPYGAVIGQILGGDTIIDKVNVTFTNVTIEITNASGYYQRLTPVGGYVGVLLNGGLIFRNMSSSNVGLTSSVFPNVAEEGYLYVNPIIGRVIAGYAFHETSSYAVTSASIPNTITIGGNPFSKNYTISDLSLSAGKLTITDSASQFTISVPDGQAMYILGAVVNSGAAAAPTGGDLSNNITAYDGLSEYWQAYRKYTVSRAGASYYYVGKNNESGYTDDLSYSHNDIYAGNNLKLVPYIVRLYTTDENSAIYARSISYSKIVSNKETGRKNNIIIIEGDCDVAAGFRGIGSIYYNNNNVRLRISKMSGRKGETQNSYTITLHMNLLEYNHEYVSQYIAQASKNDFTDYTADNSAHPTSSAGFGLFTRLQMTGISSENSVQYIELSGSVFYDVYTIQGDKAKYNFAYYENDRTEGKEIVNGDTDDVTQRRTILSVGGLAGIVNNNFYIKNVTFNNLSVEGAKSAGGLIGFVSIGDNNGSIIEYDNADVKNKGYVNVVAGLQAGGLIGKVYRTKLDIIGVSGGTDIIIKNIESKNSNPDEELSQMRYGANMNTGVGGLIGICWAADKTNNGNGSDEKFNTPIGNIQARQLFINNINIKKGTDPAIIRVLHNDGIKNNYAGGFVGSALNVWLQITNSSIKEVNVEASIAGGFIGKITQKYLLFLENVKVEGKPSSVNSIKGTRFAGGAAGWVIGRDVMYFQLLSYEISDYTIESTTDSEIQAGAGGAVGYAAGNNVDAGNANSSYICEFNNLAIKNCVIKTNYKDQTDNYLKCKCGTGGVIGVIHWISDSSNDKLLENNDTSSTNKKYKFSGYNILVKDTTLIHLDGGDTNKDKSDSSNNKRIGDLVGNNAISTTLKFVGVSVQNTGYYVNASTNAYCGKHVGYYNSDNNNYGSDNSSYGLTGGYVVFANFNAASENETASVVTNNDEINASASDVVIKYPYVIVNPYITLTGGVKITGDGISGSVAGLPINSILADIRLNGQNTINSNAIYYYAANAYYTGSSGQKNVDVFDASKLTMFSAEVGGILGTDIPVLVLDDTKTNEVINAYLRLLTNTLHDFGSDKTGEYRVNIYNIVNTDGTYSVQDHRYASLKREDGVFYTTIKQYDSGKTQFSLIDVQFLNPADTTTVAYHLYVPVFVKKVLTYRFDLAILSNTDYLRSLYTSRYGQPLIENVGMPVTVYFQYTYSRTSDEWAEAINLGENVHTNYAKSLMFYKANTNELLEDYPDDTILVLVDRATGTPYYGRFGDVKVGNSIDLSLFKSIMTYSNGTYAFSGASFVPRNLDSLMTLSTSSSGDNRNLVQLGNEEDEEDATVFVNGKGYRPATDAELTNNSIAKFKVSVTSVDSEQYYLSIFTESNDVNDELFHYYLITSPSSFTDGGIPSKISDTDPHTMAHLIMGKIFHHGELNLTSNSDDGFIMTDSNNQLTINLSAQFGLSESLNDEVKPDVQSLIGATEVYQSYLVYLNRKVNMEITKAIIGNPTITGRYNVNYTDNGEPRTLASNYTIIRTSQGYVEFVSGDLHERFASGDIFEINAAITITYSDIAIPAQFPGRGETHPSDENGVSVSAASKIAFQQSSTTYSKNSIDKDETPAKWYYSETEVEEALLDLNPIGDRVGDLTPVGINALNINGQPGTSAQFDLLAVLDVEQVLDQIKDYSKARITVTLSQKQSDKSYGDSLDISEYLSLEYEGIASSVTDNNTSFVIEIDKADLEDNIVDITIPILHFTAITGEVFESKGFVYGNYRVTVEVELLKEKNSEWVVCCSANNFIIYTNAKVKTTID